MSPKVTISVVVRNSEGFIKDAIDSIAAQDYPHDQMELVFVDESDDRTLSIINESIKKIDFKSLVIHTASKGLGAARNIALENAKGEYLLWVDADMVINTGFLRKLVEFMEQNPKAGVVKGRQALLPGGNWLATLELYSRSAGRMVDYQSPRGRYKVVGTAGALFRMKAATQVGGFDPNLKRYNEDWDIELRMRRAGWTMHTLGVSYLDYERGSITWAALWRKYWTRGYYTTYFLKKNKGLIKHFRMFPPAAFVSGIFNSIAIFKVTGKSLAFLLPFQSAFKMSAWYVGFIDSSMESTSSKIKS